MALRPANLLFALVGSVIGTAVGVLPGIGPIAGIAILLPLTFNLDATGAIIMLSAIYYGAMYGGTITTVLMRVPGEAASAVTAIDGYEMAKQGRAGAALAIAAIGSFIGGTVATLVLVVAAPPLARVALSFGPPEFFALMVLGLTLVVGLSGGSLVTGLLSALFGLALAVPGADLVEGTPRLTFGVADLLDGISFVPVIMGLYGIGEILANLDAKTGADRDGADPLEDAHPPGLGRLRDAHRAGHRNRHRARPDPGHRNHLAHDRLVRGREAGLPAPRAVRRGRHRGRRRPGGHQQRLRERVAHPPLHAGRSRLARRSRSCSAPS